MSTNKTETEKAKAAMPEKIAPWEYIGDVNIEYGGTYYNLSDDWKYGYVSALRVTDLDSGCGFDGAVLIEKLSIIVDPKYFAESAACCGFEMSEVDLDIDQGKLRICDALLSYGHYDPANEYYEPANEVVQTLEDGPMEFDGWKASKRVLTKDLKGYIESKLD